MAGHIIPQPNGKYRLIVSDGQNIDGKRKRHSKTIDASSMKQAEKQLALFVAEVENGQEIDIATCTFQEFAERWLRDYAEPNVEYKTLQRYKDMLNHMTYDAIGKLPLNKVQPLNLIALYKKLGSNGARRDKKPGGYSSATIHHYHTMLHGIFDRAVKWGLLVNNPVDRVDAPRRRITMPAAYYNAEQAKELLAILTTEPIKYRLALYVAMTTGLRRGEICGLKWQSVNLDALELSVERSIENRNGEGLHEKDPKTKSSRQKVGFPAHLVPLFLAQKQAQALQMEQLRDAYEDQDFIFTQWDGKPMWPDSLSQYIRKLREKHDLPRIDIKGLRHTCASLLINGGADVAIVSRQLRHASKSTTLNHYIHEFNRAEHTAATIVGELLELNTPEE